MNLSQHVASLPAPMPGHIRALRIERKDNPESGAAGANRSGWRGWLKYPTPYADGSPEAFLMSARVCGTYAYNFHDWFTPEELDSLSSDHRVVALDVPEGQAVRCRNQIVFSRADAHEVAVLLQ